MLRQRIAIHHGDDDRELWAAIQGSVFPITELFDADVMTSAELEVQYGVVQLSLRREVGNVLLLNCYN